MTPEQALEVLKETEVYIEKLEKALQLEQKVSTIYKGQAQEFKHRVEILQHENTRLCEELKELRNGVSK